MKNSNAKIIPVVLTTLFLASLLLLPGRVVVSSATLPRTIDRCINLEFEQDGVLPSSQGFTYTASPASVAESSVFSVSGGMLHLNTLGTGAAAYYQLPNAYDPSQDFTLELRMKVFPETGVFGVDFEVSDNVTDFEFGFDSSGIRLPPPPNSRPLFPFDPTDNFHTYKIFSPGGTAVYHFFIDGVLVASNAVSGGDPSGRLLFGDGTLSGGDGRADIDYIRYCQSAPVCAPPPSDLVSWWPGDDNANDIAGGNNGSLVGGATVAPGLVGQAFRFDGMNDYVDVGDVDLSSTFSVDAWIRPNDVTTTQMIISKDDGIGPARSYFFAVEPGGTLVGSVRNTSGGFTQYRTAIPVVTGGGWQHVAMTYDGSAPPAGKMEFYADGVGYPISIVGPYDSGGTPENNALTLKVGVMGDALTNPFSGLLDELELFNRVLTGAEIQAIFSAGSAGKCKNMTAPRLTALGPAKVWLGLKNSDDVGTKFDLLAAVFKNGSPVGGGQLNSVPGGSSGFNNAVLRTINLALSGPADDVHPGDTLSISLSVRIAVGVSGHRSGTARLWLNDTAANSSFSATIGGTASDYFLLDSFTLGTSAGAGPKKTIDLFVDRAVGGNPFKPFGTWSKTF
jgi:hypothetical protein